MCGADVNVTYKPWSVQMRMEQWVMGRDFDEFLVVKSIKDSDTELINVRTLKHATGQYSRTRPLFFVTRSTEIALIKSTVAGDLRGLSRPAVQ